MPTEGEREKRPHRKHHEGPTPEQKGYSTSEAIIELRDSLVGKSHTNREQQKPKRKPSWIEIATLVLLFLTTAGLGVQDLILHSSDKTFTDTLVLQTDSAHQQLRAYVGVGPGDLENFGDATQNVRIVRKNSGLSTAYSVRFSTLQYEIIPPGFPVPFAERPCEAAANKHESLSIFPGAQLHFVVFFNEKRFPQEQYAAVKRGDLYFIFTGRVCYDDAFGKAHYTNYCWMYRGGSLTADHAEACLTHNDSD